MGADNPEKDKKKQAPSMPAFMPFAIGMAILLFIVALYRHADMNAALGHSQLSPKEESKLQKRLKEIDDSEQYALVATEDGYYACLHTGWSTYYLHAGEIWKYGVTSKGQFGRYAGKFLRNNKVSYVTQFRGNLAECLKEEQVKLFNYPYLPENLTRLPEFRLARPPYNAIMR